MGASPEVLDPAHRLHRKLGAGHCGDLANPCAGSIEEDITSQLVSGLEDGSGDRGIRRLQTDHPVAQEVDSKAFGLLSKSNQSGLGAIQPSSGEWQANAVLSVPTKGNCT